MRKLHSFVLGLLIAVFVGAVADTVIPSKLRLQALRVGTAGALPATGNITASGTITAANFVGAMPATVAQTNVNNVFDTGSDTVQTIRAGTATSNALLNFTEVAAARGSLCVSGQANQCTTGDADGDMSLKSTQKINFSADNGVTREVQITTTGVTVTDALTVAGQNVCQANGTNCPAVPVTSQGSLTVGTYVGFSSNPTISGTWTRAGNIVCLNIGSIGSGVSNSTLFQYTLSGMPALSTTVGGHIRVRNNGNWQSGNYRIESSGIVYIAEDSAISSAGFNSGFVTSGPKDHSNFGVCYRT